MRKSTPLFRFKHGNHICVFYRDETCLLETLAPSIADGLRSGERCLCAQKTHRIKRLDTALKFMGVGWGAEPKFDHPVREGESLIHDLATRRRRSSRPRKKKDRSQRR